MKTYAVKSSARRAAKNAGLNPDSLTYLQNEAGQWYYEVPAEEPTFEEGPVRKEMTFTDSGDPISVEDKDLMDRCGHINCPHCGINLGNGFGEHGQVVGDTPVAHEKFQFSCLGCGEEFGPEIKAAPVKTRDSGKGGTVPVNQSTVKSPCRTVWDICEQMKGSRRKDVLEACVKAGVAFYTARTQYQQWLTASRGETK